MLLEDCPYGMSKKESIHYLGSVLSKVPHTANGDRARDLLANILQKSKQVKGDFIKSTEEASALKDEFLRLDMMCQSMGMGDGFHKEVEATVLTKDDENLLKDFSDIGAKRFKAWLGKFSASMIKDEPWMRYRCRDNMLRSKENRRDHDLFKEFIKGENRYDDGFEEYYERLAQAFMGREKIKSLAQSIERFHTTRLERMKTLSSDRDDVGGLIELQKLVDDYLTTVYLAVSDGQQDTSEIQQCFAVDPSGDYYAVDGKDGFWDGKCKVVLDHFLASLGKFYKEMFDFIRKLTDALSVCDGQLENIKEMAAKYVDMGIYSQYVESEIIVVADRARRLVSKICALAIRIIVQSEKTEPAQLSCLKKKTERLLAFTVKNEHKCNALMQFMYDGMDGVRRKGSGLRSGDGNDGPTHREWAIKQMAELEDNNKPTDPQRDQVKKEESAMCKKVVGPPKPGRVPETQRE